MEEGCRRSVPSSRTDAEPLRPLLLKVTATVVFLAGLLLALGPTATAAPAAAADLDCSDFATQAAAQDYFLARGGPARDPDRLDADGDGIACESNPCPCNHSTTPSAPKTPAPPIEDYSVPPPPCDPAIPAAARIFGLPSRVRVGREEGFGFQETFASDWTARLPIDVDMVGSDGASFFTGRVRRFDIETLYVVLDIGDHPVEIQASYVEESLDGSMTCMRILSKRVAGLRRVYFPSRCYNFRQRPRNVIVACGDGNFQLRGMRWRGWSRRAVRGRGTALLNDCIPDCAEGTFHRLPVSVKLSGRRLCRNVQRYVYTRISWRYGRQPSWLRRATGTAPFPCRLYDL